MNVPSPSIETDTLTRARRQRVLLITTTLAASLIFWVFVFADSGWGPLLTPLAAHLHISLATTGLLYVVWSTGYLPGALLGGTMLDRYGPRPVFFAAALLVMLGLSSITLALLVPQGIPFALLLVIAGIAGIGGGVIDASSNGLISSLFASTRGTALNLFNLLYPLGGVLLALVDAELLTLFHNDPRPSFLFTLGFIVIALLSLLGIPHGFQLRHVTSPANDMPQQAEPEKSRTPLMHLLVLLAPVIMAMMFTSGISSSVRAWTPAYIHVAYGQSAAVAAALSSIVWILSAISRLGAAALIIRIGAWRMVMLGMLVSLAGFLAIWFSTDIRSGMFAIALASIGLSPIFATFLSIGSELAKKSLGTVSGILLFTSGLSTVFCGWFFGLLLNTAGPRWAVIFCMIFVLLAGILALRLRPTPALA